MYYSIPKIHNKAKDILGIVGPRRGTRTPDLAVICRLLFATELCADEVY